MPKKITEIRQYEEIIKNLRKHIVEVNKNIVDWYARIPVEYRSHPKAKEELKNKKKPVKFWENTLSNFIKEYEEIIKSNKAEVLLAKNISILNNSIGLDPLDTSHQPLDMYKFRSVSNYINTNPPPQKKRKRAARFHDNSFQDNNQIYEISANSDSPEYRANKKKARRDIERQRYGEHKIEIRQETQDARKKNGVNDLRKSSKDLRLDRMLNDHITDYDARLPSHPGRRKKK